MSEMIQARSGKPQMKSLDNNAQHKVKYFDVARNGMELQIVRWPIYFTLLPHLISVEIENTYAEGTEELMKMFFVLSCQWFTIFQATLDNHKKGMTRFKFPN